MERGLVSIACPVLDAATTISLSIRSIMHQSYERWELLIIDDGSTDETVEIARSFDDPRIRILSDGEHRGLATRLNQAIELATGEFFARMDADDIAYPKRFERQAQALREDPSLDLVGSWVLVFGTGEDALGKRTAPVDGERLMSLTGSIPIPHPTFFGRTTWFQSHRYHERAAGFEDQLLLLTNFSSSRFEALPEILLGYREPALKLARQMRYRSAYFRCAPTLARGLGVPRSLLILAAQVGKMVLDVIAVATGLRYRLLRRRARPVDAEELSAWLNVLESVSLTSE